MRMAIGIIAPDCPAFKFIEFNPRRFARRAASARVEVDGQWLWMSRKDISKNVAAFGPHPELIKAAESYRKPLRNFQPME